MKLDIDFKHLAESVEFADFTELLMKLTGLAMALNSPEGILCEKFNEKAGNPVCCLIRDTSEGLKQCTNCDHNHHQKAIQTNKSQLYTCHAGFFDMAVPIFAGGKHIATIASGQVLSEPPNEQGFKRFLKRVSYLKYPESVLREAYFKSPWLSREKIKYVMKLLELFAMHLCDSSRRIKELETKLEKNEIFRARKFVFEHYRNPSLSLSEVAAHVGLSSAHFSHIFKQLSGTSFVMFVQNKRVDEAKKLIRNSNLSLSEICFSCGFNSVTNFNRVFRRLEHCNPSQYRKTNK